jgi:hypothetical protein
LTLVVRSIQWLLKKYIYSSKFWGNSVSILFIWNYGLSLLIFQVAEFKKFIEDMAAASLRCVAFAYRTHEMDDVPDEDRREEWQLPEDNLIMLGIVGIKVHNIREYWLLLIFEILW